MSDGSTAGPVVSVVTPVYNGERFLSECIESVLRQTLSCWEYIIVDNASTDGTAGIADRYAARDARIRVLHEATFLDIYSNHNRALAAIDPRSRYCKIIHADDWMYPTCLERMVAVAEAHPSVGVVSALRSVNGQVEYRVPVATSESVQLGRAAVRMEFLGLGWASGSPSTLLFRADLIRARPDFFDPTFWHGDTDTAYRVLMATDLGFVHEVLTYTRLHPGSQSTFTERVGSLIIRDARLILRYGRGALSLSEYRRRKWRFLARYGLFLAVQRLKPSRHGDREFHEFHQREIEYAIAEAQREPMLGKILLAYRRLFLERPQPSLNRP